MIALLSRMFSMAIKWRMCADNPGKAIERNEEHKRRRYLSADEIMRLIEALDAAKTNNRLTSSGWPYSQALVAARFYRRAGMTSTLMPPAAPCGASQERPLSKNSTRSTAVRRGGEAAQSYARPRR